MCVLDLEESEVTKNGTQELWEMTRTAVIRGLITSCVGSFLMFGIRVLIAKKAAVGATLGRPRILQSKIRSPQGENSFGKSENL